jgi:hypothetical protein
MRAKRRQILRLKQVQAVLDNVGVQNFMTIIVTIMIIKNET